MRNIEYLAHKITHATHSGAQFGSKLLSKTHIFDYSKFVQISQYMCTTGG